MTRAAIEHPGRGTRRSRRRASSATRWASWRSPPTPTTASRPRAPSATSPSAAAGRTSRSCVPRSRSRRPPRAPTTPPAGCRTTSPAAIVQAADEILGLAPDSGHAGGPGAQQALLIDAFRVDPFQAGAGVSHNMNTNEVLANRAIEILGAQGIGSGRRGDYAVVSPNDHVNMAQSTNDTFPTAMRVATLDRTREALDAVAAAGRGVRGARRRLRRRAQVGPHAHAGRGAHPARPGVRRLRADHPAGARPDAPGGRGPRRAEHRRHRGGHRPQRRAGVHQRGHRAAVGADRLPPAHRGAPRPGDPVDGADARHVGRRCAASPSTWPRSWRTCC